MREILFRGQTKSDKKWIYGNLLQTENGTYVIQNYAPFEGIGKYEVDPETVCQYTGLIDKNGRKIFEGDIVRYTDEVIGKEKVDEIKYNETHAAFCRLHKSEMGLQYLLIDEAIANKIEVIGNTFDNPELIGE